MIAVMSQAMDRIFDGATKRDLAPGETLFRAGDPVRALFLVIAGEVRLLRTTGAGAEVTVQRAGAGAVLAEASLFSARTHCEARAADTAQVLAQPVAVIRSRLGADAALTADWAAHLARSLQAARSIAAIRALRTVNERLDAWLAEGHAMPPKGRWQEVAADLGVTREALYRALARRTR